MLRQLTNRNFDQFATFVASPSDPVEYNEAAMKRLMEFLSPYIVDVNPPRPKFHSRNHIELIDFSTPEEYAAYQRAYENYLKATALLEDRIGGGGGQFMKLVEFLKFRQAAELIRAPYLARRAMETQVRENKSIIIACNFKETISKIVKILVLDYGVSRYEISLVWGGSNNQRAKKSNKRVAGMSGEERARLIKAFDSPEDRELLKDLGIDLDQPIASEEPVVETIVEPAPQTNYDALRLGTQNIRQRQEEIDRFQNDTSKFCIFTFKAGGVGLSLHQNKPEYRQREALLAPTYSAIELVQGLGRAARLTSCSDTIQTIVFYKGTIEEHVALKVSSKLKCLRQVVRQRESWQDVIVNSTGELHQKLVNRVEVDSDIEQVDTEESESEDEDN